MVIYCPEEEIDTPENNCFVIVCDVTPFIEANCIVFTGGALLGTAVAPYNDHELP